MKTKSFSPVGSLHPVFFFAVVYIVALLLSVFICSTLFYSCNASSAKANNTEVKPPADIKAVPTTFSLAVR
jgi:hypothetical protein